MLSKTNENEYISAAHESTDILRIAEQQHQAGHEQGGIQKGGAETADKAGGAVAGELLHALVNAAG